MNLFKLKQYEIIIETMEYIRNIFEGTPKTNNNWGIIHADLQGGNIIVKNDNVIPIDFGFSGYGYYLFDIGVTLASFNIKHRIKVLEGYKTFRNTDVVAEPLISAGFILGIFGAFGFNINNHKYHEWIQRRIPYVTQEYCLSLLNRKPFLLEID